MFCKSYRQLAGALWLSLYCMKCKRHVIALLLSLCVSDSCRSNSWRDDNNATMEINVSTGDGGDHDGALEREIKGTR